MIKKIGLFIFTVLICLSLVGCTGGSYAITIGEIDSSKSSISGEYNSFSGEFFKKIKIDADEALSLTFSAVTKKGELVAKVIDSDGNTIKTINPGNTAEINQLGKYKLQVEGEKHQGSFTLSWEIE